MLSMMIFAAAATMPAPPQIAAVQTLGAQPAKCPSQEITTVKSGKAVGPQSLNELPNANLYLGVVRMDVDGCPKPAIVRYDIGGQVKQR